MSTTSKPARKSASAKHLSTQDYLQKIITAQVYDVAVVTPLQTAKNLSQRLGNTVLLKREDQQEVHSFKLRGAYNKMAHLTPVQLKKGVICASAGNHAQGVALSASKMGVRAVIVMPLTTPQLKVDAVRGFGGEVVLFGESYSDAYNHAVTLEKKQGMTFVHPFDDADVIAGQGTVAMEMLNQMQSLKLGAIPGTLDAVFVAIGGGGLISGVSNYIKAVNPAIKVIGVQMNDSNAMIQSVKAKKRVTLPDVGLFSDGTAVKLVGEETFRVVNSGLVDDYIEVNTDAVCAAIKDVFTDTRSIVEPAGALAVAAIKQYVAKHKSKGKTFAAILCGANMNFDRLRFVAERAEVGEEREALFAVTLPEERGSFKRLCTLLGTLPAGGKLSSVTQNTTNNIAVQAINTPATAKNEPNLAAAARNITEFTYRISDAAAAHVFVGMSTSVKGESAKIAQTLSKNGFKAIDLTHDDLARDHIRHMVGGHSTLAKDERLLRFEFPERPGALMKFLSAMRPGWNISLFHYRNQGADYGRILVGLQVPEADNKAFAAFLKTLGYPYVEETNNPVYRLFLKS